MKAAMGLLPELDDPVRSKRARYGSYAERAGADLDQYLVAMGFDLLSADLADEADFR
jgi:methylenetetrahydrofolate--tRNA-(uracil-5-)-methyltransferase